MSNITDAILKKIYAKGRGWVFTSADFRDIGSRAMVGRALARLANKGTIRRLELGIYDYPRKSKKLGILAPSADNLAQAIASKTGRKIFPSGAMAANILGLSTQVPARPTYLTNGPSRTVIIAGRTIVFKHAKLAILNDGSDNANFVLQALYYLGRDNIDDHMIYKCAQYLDDCDIKDLRISTADLPKWMAGIISKLSP